jgi:hypothetical protein
MMVKPNDRALETVRYCLRKAIKSTADLRGYSHMQESYSRWAAREILVMLEKNRDTPPLILIEQFRDRMDEYSCMNKYTSYRFSVAKDMAEWIVDLLLT